MEELGIEPLEDPEMELEATEEASSVAGRVDGGDCGDDGGDAASSCTPEENEGESEAEAHVSTEDMINKSIEELISNAQQEIDAATELINTKRQELESAEAELEEAEEKMEDLRQIAQTLTEDEQWLSMYEKLRAWSKEKGHCNPRRNWKSKIDAEEKGACCGVCYYLLVRLMGAQHMTCSVMRFRIHCHCYECLPSPV